MSLESEPLEDMTVILGFNDGQSILSVPLSGSKVRNFPTLSFLTGCRPLSRNLERSRHYKIPARSRNDCWGGISGNCHSGLEPESRGAAPKTDIAWCGCLNIVFNHHTCARDPLAFGSRFDGFFVQQNINARHCFT